ncbi:type III-A CRISPR-associated RAMP protein Csm5 [Desulfosudis oleivorans]|uniref:CRISPR system Cms protein Csm5 n=1 Tax=Desulfosudis oleivorans (strain DSM 6200 / JCM 39069 / Hxd3) TaxID=96561 RepID=A8ZV89_DESOH|nr:type III-A CRISPR-associated RAMP protein Csm5 [Desulfosudis oleivorans]ABW66550.1 CRISPR-associated RAMP protein, Csm5 family [Desulfosudis oleivorans Hxd3]
MTTYHFKAQALTPIHIGCGCEIDPTEFLIKDETLVQFNTARVIKDLSPEEKTRFAAFADRADLKEMQNFLGHHLDIQRHAMNTIDASDAFIKEYTAKASNPNNRFIVSMMPRNPHTGSVYVPGSSIKGAIRTAVVNYFANIDANTRPSVHQKVQAERDIKKKCVALEETALNCRKSETHKDVFRLIHVSDAELPDNSTRIDWAENSGAKGIQMWVERVQSKADAATPPEFTVSIRLDSKAMKRPGVKENLGRELNIDLIMDACNRFYWARMIDEAARFDNKEADDTSWKAIEKLFPLGQLDNGQTISINPSVDVWDHREYVNRRMLIRVGHFSHFESLSVDELRQGWHAKKREPITQGSTRTRCTMENGQPAMPFGWLILTLDQEQGVSRY